MRNAAPELCRQMDILRKERKKAVERRCFLNANGRQEEVVTVQPRITEIHAELASLHAQAKEQLITGVATDLSQGAALLQLATTDAEKIRTSILEETQRHGVAMMQLVAAQQELDGAFHEAASTMDGAAVKLTDGDKEQVSETGAAEAVGETNSAPARRTTDAKKTSPAGSSSDMKCPHCPKTCSGPKGLASHLRSCKAPNKAEQAPGAEAAVEVDKDQVPNEDVQSKFACPKCLNEYTTKASLRIHQYRCKGPSGDKPASAPPAAPAPSAPPAAAPAPPAAPPPSDAPADPLADTICPLCSKVGKGTRGLASHSRNCKGVAGAAGNVDAAAAPAKRRRQSKPNEQTGAASAGAAEAVAASAGGAEAAEAGHQLSTPEEQPVVNAPHDQQPGGGPAPYQLPVDQALLHSTVQLVVAEQEKSDLTATSIRVSAVREEVGKRLGFTPQQMMSIKGTLRDYIHQAVEEWNARRHLAALHGCRQ